MIDVKNVTLTYKSGKGVFDLDFKVNKGEVMGYLGPNGAGKTTTIRALLGFMKPNSGNCTIDGLDCISQAPIIQKTLGYIPGEISFIDDMSGDEFLKFMHDMRGSKDQSRQRYLLEMFELNPKGLIKKFSKGMKQKLGIVVAFMHDPDILILDEPTSGLDPLMQNRFVNLILSEKARGKTILMSSHIFEEVQKTCDNVLIIKDGRIIKQSDIQSLKSTQRKAFILKVLEIHKVIKLLKNTGFEFNLLANDELEITVTGEEIDRFIKMIAQFNVLNFGIKSQSIEDLFMHFYGKEVN